MRHQTNGLRSPREAFFALGGATPHVSSMPESGRLVALEERGVMRSGPLHRWRSRVTLGSWLVAWGDVGSGRAAVIRVPEATPGIQAAINLAQSGDTVMIARGNYTGALVISGKTVTLASRYIETGDTSDVALTKLTSSGTILTIQATAGAGTTVQGLTFLNGDHQLQNLARGVRILDSRFINGSDQVSFENASGLVRGNFFFHASDDGIDIDNGSEPTIENNTILNSGNDGIELRLHTYTGPLLEIVIRGNIISEAAEDGIQLIDYAGASSRDFLIERNFLVNDLMVGLGCMEDGNTDENFAGSRWSSRPASSATPSSGVRSASPAATTCCS